MTSNSHRKPIELSLPSVLGYEKIARRAAEAVAEEVDLPQDRIEDLKTAVAEACMNAIEHGNQFEHTTNVTVHISVSGDKLKVTVADVGRQPIPDAVTRPNATSQSGWGMFFIQRLVDEVNFVRLPNGGNQVQMVIYLNQSSALQTIQPAEDRPRAIQPAEIKPRAIQPAEVKSCAIQPAEVKVRAIQPAEDKPRAIQVR